jgi:hypothetical protein
MGIKYSGGADVGITEYHIMPREEATTIEQPCVDMAIDAGWLHRKLDVGPGGKGWLDQIFIGPNGRLFFAEFKTTTGGLSPKQEKTVKNLLDYGHKVYIVRSVESFKALLEINKG